MDNEKVFGMKLRKVYGLLLQKAQRKGRGQEELDAVISWLTGYDGPGLARQLERDVPYGDFFREAPRINPDWAHIKGSVCGVRVETVEDPLMRQIRVLDKLVDELAKGRPMEKILRKEGGRA